MHDNNLLMTSLTLGFCFYESKSEKIIFADLNTGCYSYKCYSETCGSQSSQSCVGNVSESINYVDLQEITKKAFEAIWQSAPNLKIDPDHYRCPNCK